jgi:hypothetical protein
VIYFEIEGGGEGDEKKKGVWRKEGSGMDAW